jgi:hypothetical protein
MRPTMYGSVKNSGGYRITNYLIVFFCSSISSNDPETRPRNLNLGATRKISGPSFCAALQQSSSSWTVTVGCALVSSAPSRAGLCTETELAPPSHIAQARLGRLNHRRRRQNRRHHGRLARAPGAAAPASAICVEQQRRYRCSHLVSSCYLSHMFYYHQVADRTGHCGSEKIVELQGSGMEGVA